MSAPLLLDYHGHTPSIGMRATVLQAVTQQYGGGGEAR